MLSKIDNATLSDFESIRFHHGLELESKEAINELNNFKNDLYDKNSSNDKNWFDFDYSLDNIFSFCNQIHIKKDFFYNKKMFCKKAGYHKIC